MALQLYQATINGVTVNVLGARDSNGNLIAALVPVNSGGTELGTPTTPINVAFATMPALAAGNALIGQVALTTGNTVGITNFPSSQAVTIATVPLPTGAATASKQPALGTAGAAASDVLTIQGIAGGTPMPITGTISATTAAQFNSTPPTLAAGSSGPLQSDANGNLRVVGSFTASTSGQYNTTLPTVANGASTPIQTDNNGRLLVGNFPSTQVVTFTGQAVALAAGTSVTVSNLPTTQAVSIAALPALAAGSATIGNVGLTAGTSVSVGNFPTTQVVSSLALGATTDASWTSGAGSIVSLQKAIVAAVQATTAAITANSLVPPAPTFTQTTANASSLVVKGSAGSLYACYVTTGTTAGWLMLFDATAVPASGGVTPKDCVYCPANATTAIDFPFLTSEPYATGIIAAFSSTGPYTFTPLTTGFLKGIAQ